jgi:hypothetical protein
MADLYGSKERHKWALALDYEVASPNEQRTLTRCCTNNQFYELFGTFAVKELSLRQAV